MRTMLFIDGAYVDKAGFCVDFRKLVAMMPDLTRAYYYHCLPLVKTFDDQERYDRKQRLLTALSYIPRFEVKLGQLQTDGNGHFVQKQVDCQIVADIVAMAAQHVIERVVLVSADQDMIPGMRWAKLFGAIVELWNLPACKANPATCKEADEVKLLDPVGLQLEGKTDG